MRQLKNLAPKNLPLVNANLLNELTKSATTKEEIEEAVYTFFENSDNDLTISRENWRLGYESQLLDHFLDLFSNTDYTPTKVHEVLHAETEVTTGEDEGYLVQIWRTFTPKYPNIYESVFYLTVEEC